MEIDFVMKRNFYVLGLFLFSMGNGNEICRVEVFFFLEWNWSGKGNFCAILKVDYLLEMLCYC